MYWYVLSMVVAIQAMYLDLEVIRRVKVFESLVELFHLHLRAAPIS